MRRIVATGGVALALAMSLTGCNPVTSSYAIFDTDATADDTLPDDVVAVTYDEFDVDSARFAGEHDGVKYYLLLPVAESPARVCLGAAVGEGSMIGCGSLTGLTISSGPGRFEARLVPDGTPDLEGWITVSENVRVAEG